MPIVPFQIGEQWKLVQLFNFISTNSIHSLLFFYYSNSGLLGRTEQWADHLPWPYAHLEDSIQGRYQGHQGLCILCFTVITPAWIKIFVYIKLQLRMYLLAHSYRCGVSVSGSGKEGWSKVWWLGSTPSSTLGHSIQPFPQCVSGAWNGYLFAPPPIAASGYYLHFCYCKCLIAKPRFFRDQVTNVKLQVNIFNNRSESFFL